MLTSAYFSVPFDGLVNILYRSAARPPIYAVYLANTLIRATLLILWCILLCVQKTLFAVYALSFFLYTAHSVTKYDLNAIKVEKPKFDFGDENVLSFYCLYSIQKLLGQYFYLRRPKTLYFHIWHDVFQDPRQDMSTGRV